MFNRSGFNQSPFNRPGVATIILFSSAMSGAGVIDAVLNADMTVLADMSGAGLLEAVYIREIKCNSDMSGAGSLEAIYLRERNMQSSLSGAGSLAANLSKYHIDYIEFDGEFKPGDRIVIDSATLTVTINGQNALQQTSGDFFDLALGDNKITYTDTSGNRAVILRITHRDKFV